MTVTLDDLAGPADADMFRFTVDWNRWYIDPLPTCPLAEATEDRWPSCSYVKKAADKDWSFLTVNRIAALEPAELHRIAELDHTQRGDAIRSHEKFAKNVAFGRGTIVHLWAEDLAAGREPRQITDGWLAANGYPTAARTESLIYQPAMIDFFQTYQPELVAAEYVTIHRTLNGKGYGATPDGLFKIEGEVVAVDWKGLALDTAIPTPDGWTTMGQIVEGDVIFGATGQPVTVAAKSPVRYEACYRIRFDDGSSIVTDADHRWAVRVGSRPKGAVLTTRQIAAARRRGTIVRVPLAAALELPDAPLAVDPYLLGAWLGDGSRRDGTITKPMPVLWDEIRRRGYQVSDEYAGGSGTHNIYELIGGLRAAGVLHRKHVPDNYLRASRVQRLDLLRGLMDTDGGWNKVRHQACFETTSKQLAENVYELVVSLGWRASWFEGVARGFDIETWRYRISFRPFGDRVFLARTNAGDVDVAPPNSRQRYVQSVDATPIVATQCIQVDADDELYLAGYQMTPTHNTRGESSSHAAYPEEAAQIACGVWADYMIVRVDDHAERRVIPAVDGGYVVSIKPDGARLYPVDVEKAWDHWCHRHEWWVRKLDEKDSIGRVKAKRSQPKFSFAESGNREAPDLSLVSSNSASGGVASSAEEPSKETTCPTPPLPRTPAPTNQKTTDTSKSFDNAPSIMSPSSSSPEASNSTTPTPRPGRLSTPSESDSLGPRRDASDWRFEAKRRYNLLSTDEQLAYTTRKKAIDTSDPAAVFALLDEIDPFNVTKSVAPEPPRIPAPAQQPPDEGGTVDAADVDALHKRFAALGTEAQMWTGILVAQGKATHPFRIKDRPTVRRYEIYRGILAIAEWVFTGD